MIYTITINPAIDLFMSTPQLQVNAVNRSSQWMVTANGKGVNVSIVLDTLGKASWATGFKAGFTGEFLEESLRARGIRTYLVETVGKTRINVAIRDEATANEYKVNNQGTLASQEERNRLLSFVQENVTKDDLVVLSGSYGGVVSGDFMRELLAVIQKTQAQFVFDVDDKALFVEAIRMKPYLIKPSQEEFESFFGVHLDNLGAAKGVLKELSTFGIAHTIVSLGERGALYSNGQSILYGQAPKGEVVDTSCAGDTMIGVFLAKHYVEKMAIEESFAYAIAGGSSTAFVQSLSDLKNLEQLKQGVKISSNF